MAAPNFRRFVEGTWRTACFHRCKASTRQRMDSALRTQLLPVFGEQRLNEITASAVHEWFDRYSETAPAGANRVLDILRQIFNYGIECGHLDSNPARGVRHNRGRGSPASCRKERWRVSTPRWMHTEAAGRVDSKRPLSVFFC